MPASDGAQRARDNLQSLYSKAGELRQITEQKRGTPEGRKAAIEELSTLTKASIAKDAALNQRRYALLAEIIADEGIPRDTRCKLEAGSANADIASDDSLSPDQRFDAYAEVAWRLVRKYPERRQGYESLLRIARDGNDQQAGVIAQGLLASNAPEVIKQASSEILKRNALVGQSLSELLGGAARIPSGEIYLVTWTAKKPASLLLLESLQSSLPRTVPLVGICLDSDVDAARAIAAERKLSIQLIYDPAGVKSAVCERLVLTRESLVYATDLSGKIVSVAGLNQLMAERWLKSRSATKGGRK